jgi:hypothetical protein
MPTVQILAISTPIVAFLFMGLIALIERRYDCAPAVPPRDESIHSAEALKHRVT